RRRRATGTNDRLEALRSRHEVNQERWRPARVLPAAVRTDSYRADRRDRCGFGFRRDRSIAWPRMQDMGLPRHRVCDTRADSLSARPNTLESELQPNGYARNRQDSQAPRIPARGA